MEMCHHGERYDCFVFPIQLFENELSDLVRDGAQRIILQAVEAELQAFLDGHAAERDTAGRQGVVRNGYQPARGVLTGVGPVTVRVPKTRGSRWRGRGV